MLPEVKRCAESNDIKGLRYIFVDCLDVDPTFEKYKKDYEYCKNVPGFLENYKEISTLTNDTSMWNKKYWETLKTDLLKNFSEKRFQHMIDVAKVVYADKIQKLSKSRIEEEQIRNKQKELECENKIIEEKIKSQDKWVKKNQNNLSENGYNTSKVSKGQREDQRIKNKQKELERENKIMDEKIKREEEDRKKRQEYATKYKHDTVGNVKNGVNTSNQIERKKIKGVVPATIVAVIMIILIVIKTLK